MLHTARYKVFLGLLLVAAIATTVVIFRRVTPHRRPETQESAQSLLDRADKLAWGNRWTDAQPLYHRAEQMFRSQHELSKALYAHVSQIPPDESGNLLSTILVLNKDLSLPEAADPETRLRILVIRGMKEINFDATDARSTWQQVARLAKSLHHYDLATRATGEEGITSFLLGDTEKAKRQVLLHGGFQGSSGITPQP